MKPCSSSKGDGETDIWWGSLRGKGGELNESNNGLLGDYPLLSAEMQSEISRLRTSALRFAIHEQLTPNEVGRLICRLFLNQRPKVAQE